MFCNYLNIIHQIAHIMWIVKETEEFAASGNDLNNNEQDRTCMKLTVKKN